MDKELIASSYIKNIQKSRNENPKTWKKHEQEKWTLQRKIDTNSLQICIKLLKVTQWEKWKIKLHSAAIFFIFIFLLIRAAELKKLTIHILGEEIDTLINCWYKSKMMSLHREDSFILNKTRHLPFEPAIILVGIYPTIHFHKYKPLLFTVMLFIVRKHWNQLKCLL